jgi:hypothetical protein
MRIRGYGVLAALLVVVATAGAAPPPSAPDAGRTAQKAPSYAPPVLDDVEQMCALLVSCDGLPLPPTMIPSDFAKCVRTMGEELSRPSGIGFSLTVRECGLRANTCAQLRTCALRGAKTDACAGRGGQSIIGYCDIDGRALSCFRDKVLAVRDCPRGGEQCAVRGGEAYCTLGPCPPEMTEGAAPTCSANGTRILRCEKGKLVSLDCTAFGLKCAIAEGVAGCTTDGPACTSGATRCDGSAAVGCHHGHEVRVDCAASGMTCGGPPGSVAVGACAVAPSREREKEKCDPNAPAKCDGAAIKYCVAGKARTYPCKAVSFNRCVSDAKGARCAS